MVDNPSGESPVAASEPAEQKPKSPVATFLASSTGKLVIGGILLFLVLGAVGTLTFVFLLNPSSPRVVVVKPPSQGGAATTTTTVTPTSPPEQPLDETFTFRNIFAPTVKPPAPPAAAATTTSSDTSSTTNAPADTLVLKSITSDSGVYVATFEWNGQEYDCVEGDQVGDSPWQVVTIYSDSVVMLYGDSRVTLTPGQGYSDSGLTSK
jgi:hypothetical protein